MLHQNYFEMFGLAPRFNIDLNNLERSFRRLQTEAHPDRHASGSEAERRMALQVSTQLNDGYRALRHPASRAHCLLTLAGKDIDSSVSPGFLMAQMEWREAIEEASTDAAALEALSRRLRYRVTQHEKDLARALDERGDFDFAARCINELRFYEKLRIEIEEALERLED